MHTMLHRNIYPAVRDDNSRPWAANVKYLHIDCIVAMQPHAIAALCNLCNNQSHTKPYFAPPLVSQFILEARQKQVCTSLQ